MHYHLHVLLTNKLASEYKFLADLIYGLIENYLMYS